MNLTVSSLAITCAICYGIFYIAMSHLRNRRLYKLSSKFDGPPVLPIIGNAHLFIGNTEHILNRFEEIIDSYSSPIRLWFGRLLFIHITDPEQIKAICLSPKTQGKGYMIENFGRVLIGEGLVAAPVPKWKVHRKLIQPTFNTKILETFVEVFAAQANILNERFGENSDGPEFEVFKFVSLCTLDMICETAMGVKVGAQMNGSPHYVQALQETFGSLAERFFHFWLHSDFIFYRTQLGQHQQRNIKYLHEFTDNVIQMKQKELIEINDQPGATDGASDVCDPTPPREAFLDLLMKLSAGGIKLSDEELRDEVMTMILAGNDTSAITIPFIMLMLASHPDVQDKVYQEVWEIFGDANSEERPVEPKDLTRMKYLARVIKETLRLFPVAPYIYREVAEDLIIGEHTFPAGSIVVIDILNIHRNEKYWPEPMKFDPDRFLHEEKAKRHPYVYMAFSSGPRNCLGSQFALMSVQTIVATIVRKYILKKDNVVPVKDIRLKYEVLLKPVDPIKVRIEVRARK